MSRTFQIGMPQMAAGCLSENWLLKELGSLHWDTLCHSLRRKSHDLTDKEGRRLYATFVRVRLDLTDTLAAFHEGDELHLSIQMTRFGKSTLISEIELGSNRTSGRAQMMSTFSFRAEANNTTLAKSEPADAYGETVLALQEPPAFFTEYSEIRRHHGKSRIVVPAQSYQINPFTDSNGANLLYFASYQTIHDFLTSRSDPSFHTKSRDICYFRNCELTDAIVLAANDAAEANLSRREDVLFRASDKESIAVVNVVKERA